MTRVSEAPNGDDANSVSLAPEITPNGRWIVYSSFATNLVSGDTNGKSDIFLFDREEEETIRVSLTYDDEESDGESADPVISNDGSVIAFLSDATNLVPNDTTYGFYDVFVADLNAESMRLVSKRPDGQGGYVQGNGYSVEAAVSGDGQYVAFTSNSDNLWTNPADQNGARDIFEFDLTNGGLSKLTVGPEDVPADGSSDGPSLSYAAFFAAYSSAATNLVDGDENATVDIFTHTWQEQRTQCDTKRQSKPKPPPPFPVPPPAPPRDPDWDERCQEDPPLGYLPSLPPGVEIQDVHATAGEPDYFTDVYNPITDETETVHLLWGEGRFGYRKIAWKHGWTSDIRDEVEFTLQYGDDTNINDEKVVYRAVFEHGEVDCERLVIVLYARQPWEVDLDLPAKHIINTFSHVV